MEELEEEVTRQVNSFKSFLDNFNNSRSLENADKDFLQGTTLVTEDDFEAEVLDWALQYLLGSKCPSALAAALARNVLLEIKTANLKEICHKNTGVSDSLGYQPIDLWRIVVSKVHEICQQWHDSSKDNLRALTSHKETVSLCAIKNSRRTMEDRHVVIQDLNILFGHQGHPQTSFFAVFDGHAGTGAACYSAVHLHYNIIHHPCYPHDIKTAMKEGFTKTDKNFISKSNREGLKSGSTALCCLLRDKEMYLAWLGDSQAILVRDGAAIEMMKPHKPDREDERERIEKLGGCVVHFGTWRVNGTLAVSRAIGDAEYKPYVSSDPDVDVTHFDGTEDFIILACDGLWDVFQPNDVAKQVYSYLAQSNGDVDGVAAKLVQAAKEKGSGDNITVLAVFLRDVSELMDRDLVVPESPIQDINFLSNALTAPLNGNPFVSSCMESDNAVSTMSFDSEFEKVEAHSSIASSVKTINLHEYDSSSDWGLGNLNQQIVAGEMDGFVAELPSNLSSFPPLENRFGQFEQPGFSYERPDQLGLDNPFYSVGDTGGFFEYQPKTDEENLVEFENNVTDWPNSAGGVGVEEEFDAAKEYDSSALHKSVFDKIKPFQSNLSPNAEPFVMGSRIHAGEEPAQNSPRIPSQPLEAFIDAEPYTPHNYSNIEALRFEEQFPSSKPDLLTPTGAFIPADNQVELSTKVPTAPPIDDSSFEGSETKSLSIAEQIEFENIHNDANREDAFEQNVQYHDSLAEALDSKDNLASLSPEPGNVEVECGIDDSDFSEGKQGASVKVLSPDVGSFNSIAKLESLQSKESENVAVERNISESVTSYNQQETPNEDFAVLDNEHVIDVKALPDQSTVQENIGFECDVPKSSFSKNPLEPTIEYLNIRADGVDNVAYQTSSESETVETVHDILQNLLSGNQVKQMEVVLGHDEEAASPEAEELVNFPEMKANLDLCSAESEDLSKMQENTIIKQDLAFGLDDQQVPSTIADTLTNVETVVSEVKFVYLESTMGQTSEQLASDVNNLSATEPGSRISSTQLELDVKESNADQASPVVDTIPDTIPIADDVEDDESEDGEEWKFYRLNGDEGKPAENFDVQLVDDAEVPIFNGHAQAEILSSTLNSEDVVMEAAHFSHFSETEANDSFEELNNVRSNKTPDVIEVTIKEPSSSPADSLDHEQVPAAPVEEIPKVIEAHSESAKPKDLTTKTTAKATLKATGNKMSSIAQAQKSAPTGKIVKSKPNEELKRPAPRATVPKSTTAAPKSTSAPKPLTMAAKSLTTAQKAATLPRRPAPIADAAKKAPASKPKPLPSTAKAEPTTRAAPNKPLSDAAARKSASASLMAAKVSKEHSIVHSKAPVTASGAAKDAGVTVRRLQSTASSATSRLTTKPSNGPVRETAKKDVGKSTVANATTISRVTTVRMDVKQTKETVNKQISVVSKRVTTPTKTSSVKVDTNGTKGPIATSSPKTPNLTANNKEAAEKKSSLVGKTTPKAKMPTARSLPNSSLNNSSLARLPALTKAKTPTKTTVATVRERSTVAKSPLKTSSPSKPIKKSPAAALTSITKNSPSKSKVEDATNEKGILDASSKENAPAENGVQNGIGHTMEDVANGEERAEQQQGDSDLVLV